MKTPMGFPYDRSGTIKRVLTLFLISQAVLYSSSYALPDGRIGVLYIGGLYRSPPFWQLRSDLLFTFQFVLATLRTDWSSIGPLQQASTEEAVKRRTRLYMPRTYERMIEQFDVTLLCNANRDAVGPTNIEMLARGTRDAGMGIFMDGGMETLGGTGYPPWGETPVGELLPTGDVVGKYLHHGRIIIDRPDHELISSIPWDKQAAFMQVFNHNVVTRKPGSNLLAHVDIGTEEQPAMVTWELPGRARTFVWTGEFHQTAMGHFFWEYSTDVGANLLIYLVKRPVPQDIDLVHLVRTEMFQTATRKTLLFGLLEFAEKFGANIQDLVGEIDEVDGIIVQGREQYLQLDFSEMLETYRVVGQIMTEIEHRAVGLKARALFWVYLIEWLIISGAALMAGSILWILMAKRRLYREVETTRQS
jgi:hypothetical protein